MHVRGSEGTTWRLGVVLAHLRGRLLIQYSCGSNEWHDFGSGNTVWGLARLHGALHASLNARGSLHMSAFARGNAQDIVVNLSLKREKRVFCTMRRWELMCLAPGAWLTGQAMEVCTSILCNTSHCSVIKQDFYRKLVQQTTSSARHSFPEYSHELKKWFKGAVAMWNQQILLVVINIACESSATQPWQTAVGNHWVLAVVDLGSCTFRYYDPCGSHDREVIYQEQRTQCYSNLRHWLRMEHDMPWLETTPVAVHTPAPIQGNSWDCGVFTILGALCEALGIPLASLPWGQQHAGAIREQLAGLLLN